MWFIIVLFEEFTCMLCMYALDASCRWSRVPCSKPYRIQNLKP